MYVWTLISPPFLLKERKTQEPTLARDIVFCLIVLLFLQIIVHMEYITTLHGSLYSFRGSPLKLKSEFMLEFDIVSSHIPPVITPSLILFVSFVPIPNNSPKFSHGRGKWFSQTSDLSKEEKNHLTPSVGLSILQKNYLYMKRMFSHWRWDQSLEDIDDVPTVWDPDDVLVIS